MRTSARAAASLVVLVGGYLALAVVAGAPDSPLTVLLPARTRPPGWASGLATAAGLDGVGRGALTGLAWALVLVVLAAFALLAREAWAGRVRLAHVLAGSGAALAVAVAAPLLLSRDVYTYAAWGRIEALGHASPYARPLSAFRPDPFVFASSAQWHATHSVYGPLFTLASAGIAWAFAGSTAATILAFKLAAGVAVAAATACVAVAARRLRPGRAPLAAALVGLNPVLVVHTVGGGHVDAWIAAPLAAAAAIAARRPGPRTGAAVGVTVLLTSAFLLKSALLPALVLWLWWLLRADRRSVAPHAAVAVALTLAASAPFRSTAPFTSFGGVEAWASPSHLVGRGAQALAGPPAAAVVEAAFLLGFLVLARRLVRRPESPETWGIALLLLALSLPYLLPWYAAWFAPFLGLVADDVLVLAGAAATGVLALTLIPADPFHGLSSRGVMYGVHYGAAPALLVVLAVVAARVLRPASA